MKRLEVVNRQLRNHLDMVRTFFQIRHERKAWDTPRQRKRRFAESKFYIHLYISKYRDLLLEKKRLIRH